MHVTLVELRVRNLGVIDDATVVLQPGMTALTGETGAGKTLLVEAMSLLLGGRADPSVIRAGADEATVEGRFAEADGTAEVVVARSVVRGGRSRAWIDGRMATVAMLAETVGTMIELHGQHQHRSLVHTEDQRRALDGFGGIDLTELESARGDLRRLTDEATTLGGDARQRAREVDLLRYQVDEIGAAGIEDGDEDGRLELEEDRLAAATAHRTAAAEALAAVSGPGDTSALDRLAEASGALTGRCPSTPWPPGSVRPWPTCRTWPPSCGPWSRRGTTTPAASTRCGPVANSSMNLDASTARRSTRCWPSPTRRVGGWPRSRGRSSGPRFWTGPSARPGPPSTRASRGWPRPGARPPPGWPRPSRPPCGDWPCRRPGSRSMSTVPARPIRSPSCWGPIRASPCSHWPRPRPAGELSRTMLAVRLVTTGSPGVMVFDEVDAGVGGAAATAVGAALAGLGDHGQVLVVTHLAQVAAQADHQIAVRKIEHDGRTSSDVVPLDATIG